MIICPFLFFQSPSPLLEICPKIFKDPSKIYEANFNTTNVDNDAQLIQQSSCYMCKLQYHRQKHQKSTQNN